MPYYADDSGELACEDVLIGMVAVPILFTAQTVGNELYRDALNIKNAALKVRELYTLAGAGTVQGVAVGALSTVTVAPTMVLYNLFTSSKDLEQSCGEKAIKLEIAKLAVRRIC